MMESLAGIWYRRKWLGAKVLAAIVPERWLWTHHWKRRDQQDERLFWKSLKKWNERSGRSLGIEDEHKLKEYERKYDIIKLYFVFGNIAILGVAGDYARWANECKADKENVHHVVCFVGDFDSSYYSTNGYLSDKLRASYETIDNETVAFWYEYLSRNRKKMIFRHTSYYIREQYKEMWAFFHTGQISNHPSAITFSEEEERAGRDAMRKMGIMGAFVCIFSRDSSYNREERLTGAEPWNDLRNSDINAFREMTKYFWKEKGIQSVRMGAKVASAYQCEGAVDYANAGRTEFLDVFVFANCNFFIGDCSGIYGLAYLPNKPWAAINMAQVLNCCDRIQEANIGIYAKYYDPKRKRCLTLKEMAEFQIGYWSFADMPDMDYNTYVRKHFEIVSNTSEEILELAKEMDAIQNHAVQYTEHDEYLQQRYREIVRSFFSLYPLVVCPLPGRIGQQWLRDNEWFLE